MKRTKIFWILCILGILAFACYLIRPTTMSNKLDYLKAIDKVYSGDITGMAVVVSTADNLHGNNARIFNAATGNKDNGFSVNNNDGVRLWASKQLFVGLKNLKVSNEGLLELLQSKNGKYYIIQINIQYNGKSPDGINYLSLFVDSNNYNVYIPKEYYEPNKLLNLSTVYVEFEPNAIIKTLIKDIIS